MSYAQGTSVSVSKSRVEIEEVLLKYKATSIGVMLDPGLARVAFKIGQWAVLFKMPLPSDEEAKKNAKRVPSWQAPSDTQKQAWLEQEGRRRWRCLLLTIKAKLVSVENQVESFEEAFLAHLVLPGTAGETVADQVLPSMREGRSPFMLLAANAEKEVR